MKNMTNLRDWEPSANDAKHVDDTKMLNTVAKESENRNESNSTKEYTVQHPNFGKLGTNGRE